MAKLKNKTDLKLKQIMNGFSVPDFASLNHNSSDFNIRYTLALNYLNEMAEPGELLQEAKAYLVAQKRDEDAAKMDRMAYGVQQTVGKITYCLNRGAELSPRSYFYINNALEAVKPEAAVDAECEGLEDMTMTTSGRNIEAYVNCYARIDNLKTRVLNGKLALADLGAEVLKVVDLYAGARAVVRRRLLAHYQDSLAEAQGDKLIRNWVRPLKTVVQTLGGDVKNVRVPVEVPVEVKTAPVVKSTRNLTARAPQAEAEKAPAEKAPVKKSKKVGKASKRTKKAPRVKSPRTEAGPKLFTIAGYAVFDGQPTLRVATGRVEVRTAVLLKCGASSVRLVELPRAMNRADALAFAATVAG